MTLVWREARKQANDLRHEFDTSDPYDICGQLGIRVFEVPLPAGVSGMIVKSKGEDAEIFIESGDVAGRRRFTCAHELGHYVDRINVAGDDEFSFRDRRGGPYNLHEFFADEFAGELMMPAETLLAEVARGVPPTALAARYGVTPMAVNRRLERLEKNPPAPRQK